MTHRRQFLATVTAATIPSIAGCLSSTSELLSSSPEVSSGMSVDSYSAMGDVLVDGLREGDHSEDYYWTIITDQSAAGKRYKDDDSVHEFIQETDFTESYLIVVQYGMQSDKDLVIESVKRRGSDVRVEYSIDTPWTVGDDYNYHSSILRITDDELDLPDDIIVVIDGKEKPRPES